MVEVGVKELKNELSAYLRRVARGERLRVTSRGVPVAELLPPERRSGEELFRRLVREGRMTAPSMKRPRNAPPLYRAKRSATDEVLADRASER